MVQIVLMFQHTPIQSGYQLRKIAVQQLFQKKQFIDGNM